MVRVNRKAHFIATLVYVDEPHVIHLMTKTVPVVAVAIPSDDDKKSMFIAATASKTDWESYLEGSAALRYLFTYPKTRQIYTFDLAMAKDSEVTMMPFEGEIPEELLPPDRFFSISHTEDFEPIPAPEHSEELIVDGEWQLQEFGRFYQRYADLYAFLVAQSNWVAAGVGDKVKASIRDAFLGRPFQGGSSYLHLFNDLFSALPREERIGLEKVRYASPGVVEINGKREAFDLVNLSVMKFLPVHMKLQESYTELHRYLSKAGLLQLPGDKFAVDDPHAAYILKQARNFSDQMPALDFDTVLALSAGNPLVAAKIALSFYRRLNEAASYFAQGRVAFGDEA